MRDGIWLLMLGVVVLAFSVVDTAKNSKIDDLRSALDTATVKLKEAKQVLVKQDSIIGNFSPIITVKIPCEHGRK